MDPKTKSKVATGLMLIVLGLALYGLQYLDDLGESVTLLLLGGMFIAAYMYTRTYLLLVFGGIVTGLGIGSLGERTVYIVGEFTQIGLGIGFILIYLIAMLYRGRSHWWPLIPGVVLLLLGFNAWRQFRLFMFSKGWPLILVVIGVLILLGTIGRNRKKTESG